MEYSSIYYYSLASYYYLFYKGDYIIGVADIIGLVLVCVLALAMFLGVIMADIYDTENKKLVLFTLDVLIAIKEGTHGKEYFEKDINKIFKTKRARKEAQDTLDALYKEK